MKMFTLLILIALIPFTAFASGQKDSEMKDDGMMKEEAMESDEHSDTMSNDVMMMTDNGMAEMGLIDPFPDFVNIEKAMMAAESRPTVLLFYATWCPSCKALKEELQARAGDLEGINLLIVDYDNSDDLQKKYGVSYQHTFVQIDAMGTAVTKWNGGDVDQILESVMKEEMM